MNALTWSDLNRKLLQIETIRWLILKGNYEEAAKNLSLMAKRNKAGSNAIDLKSEELACLNETTEVCVFILIFPYAFGRYLSEGYFLYLYDTCQAIR